MLLSVRSRLARIGSLRNLQYLAGTVPLITEIISVDELGKGIGLPRNLTSLVLNVSSQRSLLWMSFARASDYSGTSPRWY